MRIINDLNEIKDDFYILDFYAPWCMPCNNLSPILEEIESEGIINIYKINVDDHLDLAKKYEIYSIPAILLFKNKENVSRKIGLNKKEDIINWIKEYK